MEKKELLKRVKAGLWIILSGTVAQVLTLLGQNIGMFNLTQTEQAVAVIAITAITSQITKYLNSRPAVDTIK